MKLMKTVLIAATLAGTLGASAQEATIRKNLGERIPQLPKIDEVSKSPMPGLFEIRVNGTEIYYSDAEGNYLMHGNLIDTRTRRNLTEERVDKLTAISFDSLPIKDAFTIVRGNGKRRLAVFEDPNCGYCKRFERDLQKVDNITVHTFLYPILSADSGEKIQKHLVRQGQGQSLAGLDGARPVARCGKLRQRGHRTQRRTGPKIQDHRHADPGLHQRRPGAGRHRRGRH